MERSERADEVPLMCVAPSERESVRRLPQVRDFEKLRLLLILLADGFDGAAMIGERMGAGRRYAGRHAAYYRDAAELLGLVDRDCWTVSARGEAFLQTRAGSDEERALLRAAVMRAVELGPVMEAVVAIAEPDVDALVEEVVGQFPRYSRATLERRVKDTLSWRAYLGRYASRSTGLKSSGPPRRGRGRTRVRSR